MGQIIDRLKRQRGGRGAETGPRDDKGFRERLNAAAEAKKALLEKFRAQAAADDPAVVERQAARQAVSEAREGREAAREATRAEDAARRAVEAEQRAADAVREATAQVARDAALKVEQKAARDARYAARKKKR